MTLVQQHYEGNLKRIALNQKSLDHLANDRHICHTIRDIIETLRAEARLQAAIDELKGANETYLRNGAIQIP